jgi:hypothetical protein
LTTACESSDEFLMWVELGGVLYNKVPGGKIKKKEKRKKKK